MLLRNGGYELDAEQPRFKYGEVVALRIADTGTCATARPPRLRLTVRAANLQPLAVPVCPLIVCFDSLGSS